MEQTDQHVFTVQLSWKGWGQQEKQNPKYGTERGIEKEENQKEAVEQTGK